MRFYDFYGVFWDGWKQDENSPLLSRGLPWTPVDSSGLFKPPWRLSGLLLCFQSLLLLLCSFPILKSSFGQRSQVVECSSTQQRHSIYIIIYIYYINYNIMIHSSSAQVVVEFSSPVPAWHLARSSASRVPVPQRPQWPAPRVHTIWDDLFGGDPPPIW